MNPYRNVPPGCGSNDTGPDGEDTYECVCCGGSFEQSELDPDAYADEPTCKACAVWEKEQQREEDAEVRAQHPTPGPWHCNLGNGSNLSNDPCIWANNIVVAVAGGPDDSSYSPAVVANARLMAAAPALYEALQQLREAIPCADYSSADREALNSATQKAQAALALATQGGAQ